MNKFLGVLIFLVHDLSFASKPGSSPQLLDSKTLYARLYLSELQTSNTGEVTASFLFIPIQIEAKCQGEKLSKCQEIANCWQYPVEQMCQDNLTQCKIVVRKKCIPHGHTIQDEKSARYKPPYSLLNAHTGMKESVHLKTLLKKWKLSPPARENKLILEKLTQVYSAEAIVKWEHWGNGESYKIDKLIP